MAVFENSTELLTDPTRVFEFLVTVRNMSQVMPASPRFEIVDAPLRLQLGTQFTAIIHKYGLSRKIVSEVAWFEEGVGFTDIMLQGAVPGIQPHPSRRSNRNRLPDERPHRIRTATWTVGLVPDGSENSPGVESDVCVSG